MRDEQALNLQVEAHNDGECGTDCGLHDEDVHLWFGLSYSNYAVLPRTLLQAMPGSWQRRFVGLLDELADATREIACPDVYEVRVRDESGRYGVDPLRVYRHASRDLEELARLHPKRRPL